MNKAMLAELNEAERLLVAETERDALAGHDEEALLDLHTRIRRARNKYVGQYRRAASAKVAAKGARGAARPYNARAAIKAEAFEEALSRVSRRLGVVAHASAVALKEERLEAARASRSTADAGSSPRGGSRVGGSRTSRPRGDRAIRSAASENRRAGTTAKGARRQAKKDARHS